MSVKTATDQPMTAVSVGAADATRLAHHTFPSYRPHLAKIGPGTPHFAHALWVGERVAGLILGEIEGTTARLLSVSVSKDERRKGGGRTLITAFETEARRRGCRSATVQFTVPSGKAAPIASLLRASAWPDPTLFSIIYTMTSAESVAAPWFVKAQRRMTDLNIQALSDASTTTINALKVIDWAPDELRPTAHMPTGPDGAALYPEASAVLLGPPDAGEGDVRGYILIHRAGAMGARVSAGWMRPGTYHGFAYGALIAHANRRIVGDGLPGASFVVRAHDRPMALFAKRHIAPLVGDIRDCFDCTKPL